MIGLAYPLRVVEFIVANFNPNLSMPVITVGHNSNSLFLSVKSRHTYGQITGLTPRIHKKHTTKGIRECESN